MKSKIAAFLLIIVVIFTVFITSCARNRDYVEAEVIDAAKSLIAKSARLNEIYWGEGIAHDQDKSGANGAYYRASSASLSRFGIATIDDLTRLTRETFTVDMANDIINNSLSSISDEDGIRIYARYYQKYSALDDTPECIMVYDKAEVFLKDIVIYNYDTVRVSRVKGESIFVSIEVTVINDEGKSQSSALEVELIEEDAGFRLNSPTYKRYTDDDYYNELQNKI